MASIGLWVLSLLAAVASSVSKKYTASDIISACQSSPICAASAALSNLMKKPAISSQRLWSIFIGGAGRASVGPNLCLPVREFDEMARWRVAVPKVPSSVIRGAAGTYAAFVCLMPAGFVARNSRRPSKATEAIIRCGPSPSQPRRTRASEG
jgi:hypothetical protein